MAYDKNLNIKRTKSQHILNDAYIFMLTLYFLARCLLLKNYVLQVPTF